MILRVAETFLRFGSFEIVKETDSTTGERWIQHLQFPPCSYLLLHDTARTHHTQEEQGRRQAIQRYWAPSWITLANISSPRYGSNTLVRTRQLIVQRDF